MLVYSFKAVEKKRREGSQFYKNAFVKKVINEHNVIGNTGFLHLPFSKIISKNFWTANNYSCNLDEK